LVKLMEVRFHHFFMQLLYSWFYL